MDLVPRAELDDLAAFPRSRASSRSATSSPARRSPGLFRGKRAPLKAALLDQRLIAGLGNIYVCEALFRAGLHPEAPAGSLATAGGKPRERAHRLAEAIRAVLSEAVEAGGSTLRDYAQTDGSLGYFQHRFRVYDREGEPCATRGLRRHGAAHRPVGPLDLLLPALPAAPIACCPDGSAWLA